MDSPENNAVHNELERFIHEQLRKLPEREAPPQLVDNVLKIIEARRGLPWWKQPFTAWPKQNQTLLFATLALLLGATLYLAWSPAEQLTAVSLADKARPLAWITGVLQTVLGSFLLALRTMPWTWLGAIAALFMIMYVACVGAGLALYRVTSHRSFSLR